MSRFSILRLAAALLALTAAVSAESTAPAEAPTSQKVIKDAAEYNAYITALNTADPVKKAAAMEAFVEHYPASIVKVEALEQAMSAYQQAGNTGKVEATAERILQLQPANIRALAIVTFIKRVHATQGDASALAELKTDAERGLAALPDWEKPEGLSDAAFARLRNQMAEIFQGAAGFAALNAKDYAAAREHYLKAVQIDPANLQNVYQLGIAELQMNPLDVDGFWYAAKAVDLAKNNAAAQRSIGIYGKAKYRHYHGSAEGWDKLVTAAADQSAPPENLAKSITPAPTPAKLAVKAVQENDPGALSFSDWEFILALRDASPANKQAADMVWRAIREKEKNGATKLKIPAVVISATKETIEAAITEENQKAHKADMRVTMKSPLADPPKPGAIVDVVGVLTDYSPSPFIFLMEKGELPAATAEIPGK
ncbi:MAG: hypothetical protein KGJ37_06525 [Verrucomicrobiota bacterium]|nr:hypothetical protein [Verrucomicrobiota bacterium]